MSTLENAIELSSDDEHGDDEFASDAKSVTSDDSEDDDADDESWCEGLSTANDKKPRAKPRPKSILSTTTSNSDADDDSEDDNDDDESWCEGISTANAKKQRANNRPRSILSTTTSHGAAMRPRRNSDTTKPALPAKRKNNSSSKKPAAKTIPPASNDTDNDSDSDSSSLSEKSVRRVPSKRQTSAVVSDKKKKVAKKKATSSIRLPRRLSRRRLWPRSRKRKNMKGIGTIASLPFTPKKMARYADRRLTSRGKTTSVAFTTFESNLFWRKICLLTIRRSWPWLRMS